MKRETQRTLTPKLRFPEFRDKPGWERNALSNICDVLNNRRQPITSSDRHAGPYPYYGASGIVDYVDEYIFDERLVLVGEDGAKWGAFENTAFLAEGKYWVNNHAHVLKPHGVIDSVLVAYLTMLDIAPFVTGAAPPKLTLAKLKSIPIPISDIPLEQQKIADCLSSLDELIAAEGRKLETLKAHKKGLMQQLFPRPGETVPRLRFPEFRKAGEWDSKAISNCLEKVIDYRGKAPPKSDSGVPLITARNVRFGWLDMTTDEYIDADRYHNWMTKGIPKSGDILFTTEAPLGNVALFPSEGKFALGQRILTLRSRSEKCIPEFLFQSLLGPTMQGEIDFHSTGSTAKGIKSAVFLKMRICYPGIKEQQRIADCLTTIDGQITAQTQKIEALKTHKRGLMQQIFPSPEET